MNAHDVKQKVSPWARQTVIYAILVRDNFEGNPFESPARLQRASAKAKVVVDELWDEAKRASPPDKVAMRFAGSVLAWIKNLDDTTAEIK